MFQVIKIFLLHMNLCCYWSTVCWTKKRKNKKKISSRLFCCSFYFVYSFDCCGLRCCSWWHGGISVHTILFAFLFSVCAVMCRIERRVVHVLDTAVSLIVSEGGYTIFLVVVVVGGVCRCHIIFRFFFFCKGCLCIWITFSFFVLRWQKVAFFFVFVNG